MMASRARRGPASRPLQKGTAATEPENSFDVVAGPGLSNTGTERRSPLRRRRRVQGVRRHRQVAVVQFAAKARSEARRGLEIEGQLDRRSSGLVQVDSETGTFRRERAHTPHRRRKSRIKTFSEQPAYRQAVDAEPFHFCAYCSGVEISSDETRDPAAVMSPPNRRRRRERLARPR